MGPRIGLALAFFLTTAETAVSDVEVVCHRGANAVAPENTFGAARQCVEWGADYIEVDVRTSKDGVLYVLHDSTVDRTTDGSGKLRDLESAVIDRLDAGSWFSADFAGERVPRLRDFLEWAKGKTKIYFDVKDADLEALIALVRELEFEEESFFWFGDRRAALKFHGLAPDLALKINVRNAAGVRIAKELFDAKIVETGLGSLSDEFLEECRRLEVRVMVLQLRNDSEAFRKIIESGADMVNLDHADAFLETQRRLAAP